MSEPVRVVYLGKLADLAGTSGNRMDVHSGPMDWDRLVWRLENQVAAGLGAAVSDERVKVAVNGELLGDRTELDVWEGDEVAFLPPVSGG